ncbi:MAG: DUF3696 domain-containing protein [Pseudomonadota bacterium]|nr:DUF3696 domain-containing protein [Pseudomonadota bacterium]
MISEIAIKNFKVLKDVNLEFSALNILAGLNGSGKSSLIQALLLLRQSFEKKDYNGLVLQGGNLLDLGSGKDIFYQYAGSDEQIKFMIKDENGKSFIWKYSYESGSDILPGILSPDQSSLENLSLFTNGFQYLNTEHISLSDTHLKSEYNVKNRNIGARGEFTAHYLAEYGISERVKNIKLHHEAARSDSLIHQTDAWLGEISPGVKLVAEDMANIGKVRLAFKFETKNGFTNEIKPGNTGFGISYVLPVVVAILKARKGDIVIVENPESHLHPKGQSVLGRMAACAAANGVQFIIETHSDHIINGIRVAVKKSILSALSTKIFYFDRILEQDEQYSEIEEIKLDRNGELSCYPKGFLDELNEQLMQLI